MPLKAGPPETPRARPLVVINAWMTCKGTCMRCGTCRTQAQATDYVQAASVLLAWHRGACLLWNMCARLARKGHILCGGVFALDRLWFDGQPVLGHQRSVESWLL